MWAVIGATGNTGRAVVRELWGLGHDPVCIVRNPAKAVEVLGAKAKVAIADLSDRKSMDRALREVDRLFIVTGHSPEMVDEQRHVLDAALSAGVQYLVRVGGNATVSVANSKSIVGRGHYAVEEALCGSPIKWVILRPGVFMQNLFGQAASIREKSAIVAAVRRDLPLAFTDVRDTSAVGARILADPDPHVGKFYEFTGVQATYDDCARIFSEVLGRPINYVQITPAQAEEGMKARGLPDWLVSHLLVINDLSNSGGLSVEKTELIRELVKRPPLTFRQFVEDHKSVFV